MSSDARVGLAEARRPPRPSLGGAERLVGSPPMVAQARRKVPVVQLFLNLEGLPRCRMRVAVLGDGNMELAGTRPSERLDPMFEEHLELFGNAAGKDSSQLLTFVVQHVGPGERWREATIRTIATAHIASDELRRAGHNNPHEGAAVPLPLRLVEDAWPEGAPPHASLSYGDQRQPARPTLHCYVHAGYHYQSSRRHSFGASPRRSISGGVDEAPEHSPRASMAMPSRRPILELAYACTPGGGSTRALVLHVRGRNTSSHRAVRLGRASLHLGGVPGGGMGAWELIPNDAAVATTDGATLPPGGRFESHLLLQWVSPGAVTRSREGSCSSMRSRENSLGGGLGSGLGSGFGSARSREGSLGGSGGSGGGAAYESQLAELRVGYAIEPLSFSEDDEGEGIGDGEPAQGAVAGAVAASSSGPRVRSVQVSLPPLVALQPFSIRTHGLSPEGLRVGGLAELELELAWPTLAAAAAGRGAAWMQPWSVVAELLPSSDWILLGLYRQPFPVGLERAARDSVVLRWRLLALTAGYVPLPALTLHKLPNAAEPGVGVGQGIELPMPAYLMGSTVLVAAKDAVVEVV